MHNALAKQRPIIYIHETDAWSITYTVTFRPGANTGQVGGNLN